MCSCARADPKRLSGLIEDALNSSAHAPASPRGASRKDSGQQKPLLVPGATREKVRERILAGLQKNGHLSSSQHDLAQIAAECEDTCYSNSKSKYALSQSERHLSSRAIGASALNALQRQLLSSEPAHDLGDPFASSVQGRTTRGHFCNVVHAQMPEHAETSSLLM